MSNNERSNAPTTRLASLASLINEFTFLFFRCRDEGATRDDSPVLTASITEGRSRSLKIWPYIPAELRFYITLTLGPSIKYSGRNKFETIEGFTVSRVGYAYGAGERAKKVRPQISAAFRAWRTESTNTKLISFCSA